MLGLLNVANTTLYVVEKILGADIKILDRFENSGSIAKTNRSCTIGSCLAGANQGDDVVGSIDNMLDVAVKGVGSSVQLFKGSCEVSDDFLDRGDHGVGAGDGSQNGVESSELHNGGLFVFGVKKEERVE